jgi:hypothetical protein
MKNHSTNRSRNPLIMQSVNHVFMRFYFPRVWYVWVWPLAGMLTV